jgi:predicted GNAT family acetyltransferase
MSLPPLEHRDAEGRVVVVRHAPERSRYELVDGEEVVGHADYRDLDGTPVRRDMTHTEVDDAYGGRGLASVLVQFALDDVRASGLRVVPHCPYVASWLRRHEGRFDDLVDWPA